MSSTTTSAPAAPAPEATSIIAYDSHSFDEYATKWDTPMGLGEMAVADTREVSTDGVVSLSAVPFRTGADAVFDHAKYFAVSHELFPMPEHGSLQFSVDVAARTPGTQPERLIHGSYTDTPDGGRPLERSVIEGQQAALMFNMTNVETNQLFDWFVSGHEAFALIERLPSNITDPTLPASDPAYVGLGRAYTQMIRSAAITPGETHTYAIRYVRNATRSSVEYLLDGELFARVDHVGIPLDTQGVAYTGTYPSHEHAAGEELKDRMNTFAIGHGLCSMLDTFPFAHPDAPTEAVSIPMSERLFGQGAEGEFSKFEITTTSD